MLPQTQADNSHMYKYAIVEEGHLMDSIPRQEHQLRKRLVEREFSIRYGPYNGYPISSGQSEIIYLHRINIKCEKSCFYLI